MPGCATNHASGQHVRRPRRSETFAVRRWLQIGAVSAGIGAAMLGFTLVGPQVGVAGADTSSEASASSSDSGSDTGGSSNSDSTAGSGSSTASADTGPSDSDDDAEASSDTDDASDTSDRDGADTEADPTDTDRDATADADDTDTDAQSAAGSAADKPDASTTSPDADDETPADDEVAEPAEQSSTADTSSTNTQPVAAAAPQQATRTVTDPVTIWTADSQAWIDSLPISGYAKWNLEGALWAVRRTFFNLAPTVAPTQISGQVTGPVTGTVAAIDPENDWLVYRLVKGPKTGTVKVNADGSYTYTPGAGFNGVDTFTVAAIDLGIHVNLLNPLRGAGSSARNLINQGAITFDFDYTTGAEHWTAERRLALQQAADALIAYFLVTQPVVLNYEIKGQDDPTSRTLASAFSDLTSQDLGFWPTIVQHKLLTGVDANGTAVDGDIEWNFGKSWGLGEEVSSDQYDFRSTAMHELLHSFGFSSEVDADREDTDLSWSVFDQFVVSADGTRLIGADGVWNPANNPNLTGANGGLNFGGSNAVDAYGRPVPLYAPATWSPGSSGSHLDDATFAGPDHLLMDAIVAGRGLGERTLSDIEIGIMRDLGYTVTAPQPQAEAEAVAPQTVQLTDPVTVWTTDSQAWIDSLPISGYAKWNLEGALWAVRRTLFNLAPSVDPIQITGQVDGTVSGTIDALDPENDWLAYRLIKGPKTGTVKVNADGSYIYTPGTGFNGVDSFTVAAIDLGLHVNLLNPLRGLGSSARNVINQGAITFDFDYTTGAEFWTAERRAALQAAANTLLTYFVVAAPVRLDYQVAGEDDPDSDTLASAFSDLISSAPGFHPTVVQNKLINGVDSNDSIADGEIEWNFAYKWALGDAVASDEYDFRDVMVHELLHSFGFTSRIRSAGLNTRENWSVFAGFVVASDGTKAIGSNFQWDTDYDPNLTGGGGGLYFGGANAIAAYGAVVPLYTPSVWQQGSSMGHLDDSTFTGDEQKIMNANGSQGLSIRKLSAIEIGILRDLGYTVRAL